MSKDATFGYMDGFEFTRKRGDELDYAWLAVAGRLGDNSAIAELVQEIDNPDFTKQVDEFLHDIKQLTYCGMVWTTNRDNSLTFGDTNGGWIGWLWKDKKRGTQIWKPKKQDLANLKALLEKYGFTVLGRIPEGIVNFLV